MDEPLERRAVISGAAQSDIGRRLHRSGLDLTIEAALRAIDDAGLTVDDIAGFADIGRHLDSPVSNYSSGMSSRLGFAIAINVDCDIFLADELSGQQLK